MRLSALKWCTVYAVLSSSVTETKTTPQTCDANSQDPACSSSKAWWQKDGKLQYRSPVMQINTLNFNSTLTNLSNHSLLIAFFDPRSMSFKETKTELEDTARALTELAETGQTLGYLGAVDMTVDSYLMNREAPEATSSSQDAYRGSFKFGRSRFLPLIIMHYRNSTRDREFKGLIKKDAILEFFGRMRAVGKGEQFDAADELNAFFLQTPAPFAVACDPTLSGDNDTEVELARNFSETFRAVGEYSAGELVFVNATEHLCSSVFGPSSNSGPRVFYVRRSSIETSKLGMIRANSNSNLEALTQKVELHQWLRMQRSSVLEQITPDNSWIYLDKPAPLVIFLVDEQDLSARHRGEELFANIEDQLEVQYYQLVWADCKLFGEQFGLHKQCPTVMLADMFEQDLRSENISLQEIEAPAVDQSSPWTIAASASERLLRWLESKSDHLRYRELVDNMTSRHSPKDIDAVFIPNKSAESDSAEEAKEEEDALHGNNATNDVDDSQADSAKVQFLDSWPGYSGTAFNDSYNESTVRQMLPELFHRFHSLLQHMTLLKESYQARYPDLFFNFSNLDRTQALHKNMQQLVSNADDVQAILEDVSKRKKLWKSVEAQIKFVDVLEKEAGTAKVPGATFKVKNPKTLAEKFRKSHQSLGKSFRLLFETLHSSAAAGKLGHVPEVKDVERRAASGLSMKEFFNTYARPGIPVIITGLNATATEEESWTLDFFRRRCNVTAEFVQRNPKAESWGRLQRAGRLPLAEFIDTFSTNLTRRKWYLHDWSLPRFCPASFGPPPFSGYTVPKYFAGDYFQRAAFDGYRHSWPSLFIGSGDTQSSMHIDSGNTNFWLHLLSGRKEWRFYSRRDLINLYAAPAASHFHLDVFKPDYDKLPLARYAQQYRGIQETGELMFIPAANPHAVRNLEDIHGISMNYVDASNIELSLLNSIWGLEAEKLELYTDGTSIPHGLRSDQQPMTFGEWKAKDWTKITYDLY